MPGHKIKPQCSIFVNILLQLYRSRKSTPTPVFLTIIIRLDSHFTNLHVIAKTMDIRMLDDTELTQRIAALLHDELGITQENLFGGLCFLQYGHILCGAAKNRLIARVGADHYAYCLRLKHASEMNYTGKPLKGMIYVAEQGINTTFRLQRWVDRCLAFSRKLPVQ